MTRSNAKLSAFGRLVAAAALPLLLPLLQQPPPSLAAANNNTENIEIEEATSANINGVTTFPLQQTGVSDGHLTSTATEQETTVTLSASVTTVAQWQSDEFVSESTVFTITVEHEQTTTAAAPDVTYTWELSSNAATAAEMTTKYTNDSHTEASADGETSFAPQLSTNPATESSTVEIAWTTASKVESTAVSLGTTDGIDKTTLTAAVSADTHRTEGQTDILTSTEPVDTTWSEHTHSQTIAVSDELVRTSSESGVTTEEAGTYTEASTRATSDSQSSAGWTIRGDSNETQHSTTAQNTVSQDLSSAGWTIRGDSNETQHSTTAQNIVSQDLPISTSESVTTTDFPQRRIIHAVATYGVAYQNVTAANLTEVFKESFTTALTLLLKIDRTDITILMIASGSTIVHFEVSVPSDGVERAASDLKNKTDELQTAFISSVKNYSAILVELLEAAGKPNITVHIMHGSSSTTASGPVLTTAATKTSNAPATSSLADGEIAGVVIGSVLGGLLLVAIVACLCKKRSSGSKLDEISSGGFKARSIANYEMVTGPGA